MKKTWSKKSCETVPLSTDPFWSHITRNVTTVWGKTVPIKDNIAEWCKKLMAFSLCRYIYKFIFLCDISEYLENRCLVIQIFKRIQRKQVKTSMLLGRRDIFNYLKKLRPRGNLLIFEFPTPTTIWAKIMLQFESEKFSNSFRQVYLFAKLCRKSRDRE